MTTEIRSLTGIRGIAALFVAVFHFYRYAIATPGGADSIFNTNSYIRGFFGHGYLAVDLFFILSAFVMTLSSRKLFENKLVLANYALFMKKRWIRIYPSYFFILLYAYLIQEQGHRTPNFIISLTLLNILVGASFMTTHLWSLTAEWITYLFYPLLLKISRYGRYVSWNYLLIAIGVFLLYAIAVYRWRSFTHPFMLEIFQGYPCLLKCFANYLLGIAAFGLYDQRRLNFLGSTKYALIIVVLLVISLIFAEFDLVTSVLFVFLIISIADDNLVSVFLGSKLIYFFGEISYPLYLINFLVFLKLTELNGILNAYTSNMYGLYILFAFFMLLCIALAYVFHVALEKPLLKYFNRRLKTGSFPFNFYTSHVK